MKSFDLTFSGAVHPDCDPQQVKQGMARLFAIRDRALLDEIFSGKTIVLRHNLDRKTAADYFRRISLLGGQATLVKSPKHRAVHRDEVLILEADTGRVARDPAPSPSPGSSPVPSSTPLSTPSSTPLSVPSPALTLAGAITQLPEESATGTEELDILRVLIAKTTQESDRVAARLQRQKDRFERIAQEELDKIAALRRQDSLRIQRELAVLEENESTAREAANTALCEVQETAQISRDRADSTIASLDALIEKSRSNNLTVAEQLSQSLAETQRKSEEEIRRLEELLEKTRAQAQHDIAALEQQLRDASATSLQEIELLQDRKSEARERLEEELIALEQRKEATREDLAMQTGEFSKQKQELLVREQEQANRFEKMEENIKATRTEGIARVDQSVSELKGKTRGL